MPRLFPARPHFVFPLNGDTDRRIALQIEASLDAEDALMGFTISDDGCLPPTLDDADRTFARVVSAAEDTDYLQFWGW